jgi:hypothetical protein
VSDPLDDWWNVDPCEGADCETSPVADAGADVDPEEDEALAPDGPFKLMWGDLLVDEGYGEIGFVSFDASQGGALCELAYDVVLVAPVDGCGDCEAAWTVAFAGLLDVYQVDGACDAEGWTWLEGEQLDLGWAGETMFVDLGQGFYEAGSSGRDGDLLFFDVFFD